MRIATAHAHDTAIVSLQKRQQQLASTQERLTTGKRVHLPSDDPVAAARAERALAVEQRVEAGKRAVESSRNAMTLAESALGDAGEVLHAVRDVLVAAGNASYSDKERQILAAQLAQHREHLVSIANRRDSGGMALFAGLGLGGDPARRTVDGSISFAADASGQMPLDAGEILPRTVSGQAAWASAMSGNGHFETAQAAGNSGRAWIDAGTVIDRNRFDQTRAAVHEIRFSTDQGATVYEVLRDGAVVPPAARAFVSGAAIEVDGRSVTVSGQPAAGDSFSLGPSQPGLTVFDVIDRAIEGLRAPLATGAEVAQHVAFGLRDIDAVSERLQSVRAAVGDTLNRIDAIGERLETLGLNARTERANAEDLDMLAAISDFQNKHTGYDAALKTYAQVQRMSLFDYLR